MGFIDGVSKLGRSLARGNGDFFLQLNYLYTPIFLVVLSGISFLLICLYVPVPPSVTTKCWTPAQFTQSHVDFAQAVCAPGGPGEKYEIRENGNLGQSPKIVDFNVPDTPRPNHRMPLWLLFQAILFIVPIFFWKAAIGRTGINVDDVIHESNAKTVGKFVRQFDQYFNNMKKQRQKFPCAPVDSFCLHINKVFGFYLILVFLVLKIWYIYNITLQFNVMSAALGREVAPSTNLFKFRTDKLLAENIINEINIYSNNNVTIEPKIRNADRPFYLCDFAIRQLGNIRRYTVQCHVNIQSGSEPSPLIDDLYTILVVWLSFVFVANIYSFLSFLVTICRAHVPIKHQLLLVESEPEGKRQLADEFVDSYLMQDGAFLLGMIDKNTNKGVATDVLEALWGRYLAKKQEEEGTPSETAKMYPTLEV